MHRCVYKAGDCDRRNLNVLGTLRLAVLALTGRKGGISELANRKKRSTLAITGLKVDTSPDTVLLGSYFCMRTMRTEPDSNIFSFRTLSTIRSF